MSARRLSRLGRLGAGLLMASLWAVAAGPVAAADRAEAKGEAPSVPIPATATIPPIGLAAATPLPGGSVPWTAVAAPPALGGAGGALLQGGGGAPQLRYYALDVLGSVRVVFDAAGAVVSRADYEPFGAPIPSSTTGTLPRQQYTGHERDGEVGVDYFGARMYVPQIGRMPSVDPLYVGAVEDPQRWNRYAYALNSPLVYSDPDGRQARECSYAEVAVYGADGEFSHMSYSVNCRDASGGGGSSHGSDGGWGTTLAWLVSRAVATASAPFGAVAQTFLGSEPLLAPGLTDKEEILGRSPSQDMPPLLLIAASVASGPQGKGAAAAAAASRVVGAQAASRGLRGSGLPTANQLLADAAALYPKKVGRVERHHIEPMYIGGPKNGETVLLDAAYHQMITNAFRDIHPYGAGALDPFGRSAVMKAVYGRFPLLPVK